MKWGGALRADRARPETQERSLLRRRRGGGPRQRVTTAVPATTSCRGWVSRFQTTAGSTSSISTVRTTARSSIGPGFVAATHSGCSYCTLTASCPAQLRGKAVTDD